MKSAIDVAKSLTTEHNVAFNVYDEITGQLLQHHEGHNSATNSMLTGIGHYLMGDGVLNQGSAMLEHWVPHYMSLGTMGLYSQDADSEGLPTGIGYSNSVTEEQNFVHYASHCPGFGADGYDLSDNNDRSFPGLGRIFSDKSYTQSYIAGGNTSTFETTYPISSIAQVTVNGADVTQTTTWQPSSMTFMLRETPVANSVVIITYITSTPLVYNTVDCELISASFPRVPITYRKLIPESSAELPRTVDVILSAMVSTGALKSFREARKDYVFITEAGLWSNKFWPTDNNGIIDYSSGDNGLLAGYRIMPTDDDQQDMTNPDNREALRHEILRVGFNQVVQIVWKLQLGSICDFNYSYDESIIRQANAILEAAINGTPTS